MNGSVAQISGSSVKSEFSASVSGTAKKKPGKRLPPLSLRLSESERAKLKQWAGSRPLGRYIRERLFHDDNSPAPSRTCKPSIQDHKILAELLRALAQADIIRTAGKLRRACDDGSLVLSDEAELALRQACTEIAEMRKSLVVALGLKAGAGP